ncbi:MAG: hypothetical protein A3A85_07885 [Deltaproteobacteria bacterium RIFCSPLOWO2_01_FULL_42_9]|nr:MAG: hypothetical protein A3A85_07885 [Deltaproteobacteria bacterium RIFCSPLOWO2_01_FULL_42_9]
MVAVPIFSNHKSGKQEISIINDGRYTRKGKMEKLNQAWGINGSCPHFFWNSLYNKREKGFM